MIKMAEETEVQIPTGNKEEKKFLTMGRIILGVGIIGILALFGVFSIMKWSLVDQPFMGGLFNTSFWNTPLYIFCIPIVLLMYFVAWAYWAHFKWDMMAPFHGLGVAMSGHSDVVFKCDLNLNFILKSEAGACLVFEKERYNEIAADTTKLWNRIRMKIRPVDQSVSIAKFLQGSWETNPMVNIGSIPTSILLDANGWTKDVSPERTAIAAECDLYNDTNTNGDQIHSLAKAWKYMDSGRIPTPPNVKLYTVAPWIRIDNSYSSSRNSAAWGGFVRQLAETLAASAANKGMSMTTAGIVVFISCLLISGLMFLMKIWVHVPAK